MSKIHVKTNDYLNQGDIIGEVGSNKSNVQITSGAINLRNNTTNNVVEVYNGTAWVNAFEGTYNPGFWRIYL